MQIVQTIPFPTYFKAYPGTLATGEIFRIPNRHRREGDLEDNPQVRVIIQNSMLDPFTYPNLTEYPILQVLDDENTVCSEIYAPNAWQIETEVQLKIQGRLYTTFTPLQYKVLAFYKKPER